MANGHGGARANAGRKAKQQKYGPQITVLETGIADQLPQLLDNMLLLANGGYEQITETWEPAGLIYISKQIETKEGSIRVSELAFPELPPEQLVCIRRSRSVAAPDRRANEYLINRVAGTPVQQLAVDTDPDGTLDVTAAAMEQAAKELAEWRRMQSAMLSSLPSAPPTPPTSATNISS